MNATSFQGRIPLLICACLAGCGTVPVVPHAMNCEVSAELMAGKCASPAHIADDATYAALVDAMHADRRALRECGMTADALRDAIRRCNQAADAYNIKIDALNATK